MEKRLVKIDRNGSKHYEGMVRCERCGGTGYIVHHMENGQPSIQWTDGGVCWKCLGEGKVLGKWIERTPEYQAKLDAKREERHRIHQEELEAQKIAERHENMKTSLEKIGFSEDGKAYLFLGRNNNEKLKELGARFDYTLGWYSKERIEGYDFLEVDISRVGACSDWGRYCIKTDVHLAEELKAEKESEWQRLHPSTSVHVGTVGMKLEREVTYDGSAHWESKNQFGYGMVTNYIHTFHDSYGNVFTWKTQKALGKYNSDMTQWNPTEVGTVLTIRGTIKEHSEYKGVKQTVLERCKIS